MRLAAAVACALVACAGNPPGPPPPGETGNLELQLVASGLSDPLHLTAPAGDARLFIVEQEGRIRIVRNGLLLATPFLDLTALVGAGGERGLLGLAFHPNYAANGYFYVNYTENNGDTRIERYTVSADPDVADVNSAKLILFVPQPYANHNGGLVLFGPDGKLYIGMGDGGSGGDPENRAQNADSLLGKLLRIDVDAGDPYAVPPDNPYATGGGGGRGEIWAIGLRNPWRFAFDRGAGLLYIADVGQNAWEEVNVAPARQGGLNYGWRMMEGAHCYNPNPCSTAGLVLPALEYGHGSGCSITGGFVYRGSRWPSLVGHYFYSDYCAGWIRSFTYASGAVAQRTSWNLNVSLGNVLSLGEDAAGELYVLTGGGRVYRIAPAP
ncbi:MAG TPA: PQQ-dependent sugar dehydrogenase [Gemmatimonadales bacterium]|nr:PQQ-dependent sugar dehydrogenase [Gemmatimonadales bacterium]